MPHLPDAHREAHSRGGQDAAEHRVGGQVPGEQGPLGVDDVRQRVGLPGAGDEGARGRYRLGAGADLPPLLLDDEQAVAVTVALQTAARGVAGIEEASLRALATVRQVMPSRLRHRVDALQVTAVAPAGTAPRVDAEVLLAIGAACRDHLVLRFGYHARDDTQSARRVEPHRLASWGQRWYLVAWDTERADWRTLRADRMEVRSPTGPRFTPRDLPDDDLTGYLRRQFSSVPWPCTATVLMHAPADQVSRWVRQDQGLVTAVDERRCRVAAGSWSWGSLAAWLSLFEVDFAVEEPDELRQVLDEVVHRLQRAATSARPAR